MAVFTRRTFLKLSFAVPLGASFVERSWAGERPEYGQVLVIYGVTPKTPPSLLRVLLTSLDTQGLKAVIAVDPNEFDASTSSVFPSLMALAEAQTKDIDIIPLFRGLDANRRYFLAREGHDGRRALQDLLFHNGGKGGPSLQYETAAFLLPTIRQVQGVQEAVSNSALAGLRSAGFRTLLELSPDYFPAHDTMSGNGVLTLHGGSNLTFDGTHSLPALIASATAEKSFGQISVLLESVTNASPWHALAAAEMQSQNRPFSIAPLESPRPRARYLDIAAHLETPLAFHQKNFAPYGRLITVVVVASSSASGALSLARGRLSDAGIPTSLVFSERAPSPDGPIALSATATCPQLEFVTHPAVPGLTTDGRLRLLSRRLLSGEATDTDMSNALLGSGDIALILDQTALENDGFQQRLLRVLQEPTAVEDGRFVSLETFTAQVLPIDPTFEIALQTSAGGSSVAAPQTPIATSDTIIADARVAWSYFQRFTQPSGLCVASAQVQGDYTSSYGQLAMWDIGSHLFGIRSAHKLDLINRTEFLDRAQKVIRHLPHVQVSGHILPCGLVDASTGHPLRGDFYPSDVGRLLSALFLLREAPELQPDIDRCVSRWQLSAMVENGRLMEVSAGQRSEFFYSQGAHYACRAFANFGIHAQSPYPSQGKKSLSDWRMSILYAAGQIGPLGPEPLLEEGLEMGLSPESSYLATVLLAAQMRTAKVIGKPVAPSESPIDRAPWFIYEGLKISAPDPRWTLQTSEDSVKNRPGKVLAQPMLLSTKAAYMWAALYPGDYTGGILRYTRAKTRIPAVGFASGVYSDTGAVTNGYTDINTNGVILTALAHMSERL